MEGFGEHGGWQRVLILCPWAFLGTVLGSQVGGDVLGLAAGLLASPPPDSNGEAPSLSQATFLGTIPPGAPCLPPPSPPPPKLER